MARFSVSRFHGKVLSRRYIPMKRPSGVAPQDWRSVHSGFRKPIMSQAIPALPGDGFLDGISDKVERFRYLLRILEC